MEENQTIWRPNIIREKAYAFSLKMVLLSRKLKAKKVEAALTNQLLRSGTSICANIEEASAAISRAEFSAKMSLSFKEARETQFWLRLLVDSGSIDQEEFQPLSKDVDELLRLLWTVVKKTRLIP